MRLRKNSMDNEKGFVLPFVLVILLVMSVLGTAIIGAVTNDYKIAKVDGQSQSAYYIAEAGINKTIDLVNTKIKTLNTSVATSDALFSGLQNYMSNPFILTDFESNFGKDPIATTTITGVRVANSNTADYTLISVGRIGNSSKTVRTAITVNWEQSQESTILDNNFIYSSNLIFEGTSVNGEEGSIISGGLMTHDLNGGAKLNVSDMYFGGPVIMDGGSASFGSQNKPGSIYVRGNLNLWNGTREVYGDIHVDGDFKLKDAKMHGDVYVNGNLELGWTPQVYNKIFYTGTLTKPNNYSADILNKCVKVTSVPVFTIPYFDFQLKKNSWYESNGYTIRGNVNETNIPNNAKMLVDNYISSSSQSPTGTTIIISKGSIDISGWRNVTGVLIAPNGSVKYNGASFTGIIISKNGFLNSQGGSYMYMKKISDFFTESTMPIIVNEDMEAGSEGAGSESTGGSLIIKFPIKEN